MESSPHSLRSSSSLVRGIMPYLPVPPPPNPPPYNPIHNPTSLGTGIISYIIMYHRFPMESGALGPGGSACINLSRGPPSGVISSPRSDSINTNCTHICKSIGRHSLLANNSIILEGDIWGGRICRISPEVPYLGM